MSRLIAIAKTTIIYYFNTYCIFKLKTITTALLSIIKQKKIKKEEKNEKQLHTLRKDNTRTLTQFSSARHFQDICFFIYKKDYNKLGYSKLLILKTPQNQEKTK